MSINLDDHHSIIEYCRLSSESQLIGGSKYGNQVIKLPGHNLVVKFGQHVSSHEAENQQKAYNIIDSTIVTVPRVYEFFMDDEGWGYMVSDFITGKVIDPLPDSYIQRLANVLYYFGTITSDNAGSLCGRPSIGLLWSDTNDLTISNIQRVENWFNSRLFPKDGEVHFDPSQSILCHLDIVPRNILWLDDDNICLLDWASAGFYPRVLEFASLSFQEYHFSERLLNAVGFGSENDKEQQKRICQALYNNERYSL
ncbi:hypothetical protein N7456_009618 [Penicillium angulare]|uniref:Aminoglycoside phosphotransferase domain-containing protein n=1 Tax=Penicillium angulare TaxID=116970 RepID=A0A9W9F584_9EURO|nr:hypothetical protein N7456_009618 [Penicillium angulare]